jgi:hypothetical protein
LRRSQDYRFDFAERPPGAKLDAPLSVDPGIAFSALKGAQDGDGSSCGRSIQGRTPQR